MALSFQELTWVTHFAQRHHVSLSKRPFNEISKDFAHNTSPGQKQTDEKMQNASYFTIHGQSLLLDSYVVKIFLRSDQHEGR